MTSVQWVIEQFEGVVVQALNGATSRFDWILTDATIEKLSVQEVTGVYYVTEKIFAGKNWNKYYNNRKNADLYLTENRKEIRKNKLYLFGSVIYAWNGADDELAETTTRMRLAVYRTQVRVTVLRLRARMSVRVWLSAVE